MLDCTALAVATYLAAPTAHIHRRTWTFNTDKAGAGNNCTKASAAVKYDQFFGLDPSNATQMNDQTLYQVAAGTDFKYGWVVSDCTTTLPFICQVPSTIFPCYPPPSSPPPPPSPPSPPSPPLATKCELCQLLGMHCSLCLS